MRGGRPEPLRAPWPRMARCQSSARIQPPHANTSGTPSGPRLRNLARIVPPAEVALKVRDANRATLHVCDGAPAYTTTRAH